MPKQPRVLAKTEGSPKVTGRPSVFSEELVNEICERLEKGQSLRIICKDDHMPDRTTVLRWAREDDAFATKYARAREGQAEWLHDDMAELEDGVVKGEVDPTAARVVLASKQWRASKLAPKKYGDVSKVEHTGKDGGPIRMESTVIDAGSMSAEERDTLRALLQAAKARKEGA